MQKWNRSTTWTVAKYPATIHRPYYGILVSLAELTFTITNDKALEKWVQNSLYGLYWVDQEQINAQLDKPIGKVGEVFLKADIPGDIPPVYEAQDMEEIMVDGCQLRENRRK